jgi:hypothetical protein
MFAVDVLRPGGDVTADDFSRVFVEQAPDLIEDNLRRASLAVRGTKFRFDARGGQRPA